jgi:DNA-binding ferritin-like protein
MATKKFKSNVDIQEKLIISSETAERVLVLNEDKETVSSNVTDVELGHLSGVTSGIQQQIEDIKEDIETVQERANDAYTLAEDAIPKTQKGQANGVATLDENGLVPSSQLPSYVDDVLEFEDDDDFPAQGEFGKIYVALNTLKIFRWSGSTYIEISPSEVNSVNGRVGVVSLDSSDLEHTQETPANWLVVDESSIAAHLDELASRTKSLEQAAPVPVGDIAQTNFSFENNQSAAANVTGLVFDNLSVRSFVAEVAVERDTSSEAFIFHGVNINGNFSMSQESVGDDAGVEFTITSSGQIQYTSTNGVAGTIKFRARSLTF